MTQVFQEQLNLLTVKPAMLSSDNCVVTADNRMNFKSVEMLEAWV